MRDWGWRRARGLVIVLCACGAGPSPGPEPVSHELKTPRAEPVPVDTSEPREVSQGQPAVSDVRESEPASRPRALPDPEDTRPRREFLVTHAGGKDKLVEDASPDFGPRRPASDPRARVVLPRPRIVGSISEMEVSKTIRSRERVLKACYERELERTAGLAGKIVIEWKIREDGKVSTTRVSNTTMGNAKVETCLIRQVRALRFPKSGDAKPVRVQQPILFYPS